MMAKRQAVPAWAKAGAPLLRLRQQRVSAHLNPPAPDGRRYAVMAEVAEECVIIRVTAAAVLYVAARDGFGSQRRYKLHAGADSERATEVPPFINGGSWVVPDDEENRQRHAQAIELRRRIREDGERRRRAEEAARKETEADRKRRIAALERLRNRVAMDASEQEAVAHALKIITQDRYDDD